MTNPIGVAGESARHQAEIKRQRQAELERLQQAERNWDGGAQGEESTAEAIAERCPDAVVLHDRRMPGSRANIDHIVLVPSGVWVIDSKRMKGRIKVDDGRGGAQKLLVNGRNQTELVHKLTNQVNAVTSAMAGIDTHVPVHGAFCFWLPIRSKLDLLNPFSEDNGLPVTHTWTINGYPLFHWRLMVKRLNSAGTLTSKRALDIADALAASFPAAAALTAAKQPALAPERPSIPPMPASKPTASAQEPSAGGSPRPRLAKDEFKAMKAAERDRVWEQQRKLIEAAIGQPVPPLLADRLSSDGAIWCHHALWHSRVYLGCIHNKVGSTFPYTAAASVAAAEHDGRPGAMQWRALTAFLEHLRCRGYLDFEVVDGRIGDITVDADLNQPPLG